MILEQCATSGSPDFPELCQLQTSNYFKFDLRIQQTRSHKSLIAHGLFLPSAFWSTEKSCHRKIQITDTRCGLLIVYDSMIVVSIVVTPTTSNQFVSHGLNIQAAADMALPTCCEIWFPICIEISMFGISGDSVSSQMIGCPLKML